MVDAAESTRERILQTAAQLIMNQGFAATSVRQIGEVAGVSQSALYYHIESKASLLRALHERFLEDMLARLSGVENEGGSPTAQLRRMIEVVMVIIEDHQAEVTVFLREQHALPPEMKIDIVRRRDLVDEMFDRTIRRAIEAGEFRPELDVHLTRLAVLGTCNWAYQWFRPGGKTSREIAAAFADILLRGLSIAS